MSGHNLQYRMITSPDGKQPIRDKVLSLLQQAGYEYLSAEQVQQERHGRIGYILLEDILRQQLQTINRFNCKGDVLPFSADNIDAAINLIGSIKFDGLQKTNEAIYDLLTLGTALTQSIEGDNRSFNLAYVDWQHVDRNRFHVACCVEVERAGSTTTIPLDLVLFVNGIPFVVIECAAADTVEQAAGRLLRYQESDACPGFFAYSQMLLTVSQAAVRYAAAGTPLDFWSEWHELTDAESGADEHVVETPYARNIDSLCRPERLLEFCYKFTVFENGIRKIARYQQYFVIKSILQRISQFEPDGRRKGGMVWHTQGSGKTLSMVMLVRNLLLQHDISQPRIVLVSDRTDLDRQLANTLAACGLEPHRATSGRHLLELVSELKAGIVTTLIQKFDKAMKIRRYHDDSANIFMLVDESHRSNFGMFADRMRQMFRYACYLGFTGTPLLKKEKNNFEKFGGVIEPHYSIRQAVQDRAIVPLLYEGRHTQIELDTAALDNWFEHYTLGLSATEKAQLKQRYASVHTLDQAEAVIWSRALDISQHFRSAWQGTGFKAQLVAPSKEAAIRYHRYLNEIGLVSSRVVISPPDEREFPLESTLHPAESVVSFWQQMMQEYGNKDEYEKQIINQFKNGAEPEILIVVSKLLTGFDAPHNTVLYLCASLKEHTLLQAIARVNRLCENKDFGFIVDYVGTLGELDKALNMYSAFEEFDAEDIQDALLPMSRETAKLADYRKCLQAFHVPGSENGEPTDDTPPFPAEQSERQHFYDCLFAYGKTLSMALSNANFVGQTDVTELAAYKDELRNCYRLKAEMKRHFAEDDDKRDYEPRIRKLLNTYIRVDTIIPLNRPVNIFNEQDFNTIREEVDKYNDESPSVRAAFISNSLHIMLRETSQQPKLVRDFSAMMSNVVDAYRHRRLCEAEYLNQMLEIRDRLADALGSNKDILSLEQERALAVYHAIKPVFGEPAEQDDRLEQAITDTAVFIERVMQQHWKVNFFNDLDARNRVCNVIDDYLYDSIEPRYALQLSTAQKDSIIGNALEMLKQGEE
ncbi:MAG: HsdR family type I site-specific deoxyribonuclease [Gammaproteobacteria bacterium]|nr:HsdR family type I site-specific deoxyribonuclease [Gammaproteobacteria bacterium]MDH5651613.1 HsdR family type I site-specific deoxyribonuclease [Gammaproteobacteria bacterium]